MNPGLYGIPGVPSGGVRKIAALSPKPLTFNSGNPDYWAQAANTVMTTVASLAAGATVDCLRLSGRGCINFLALCNPNPGTPPPFDATLVVDGETVFSGAAGTSGSNNIGNYRAVVLIGAVSVHADSDTVRIVTFQPVYFDSEVVVRVRNTHTAVNQISRIVNFELHK